ncbi:MULTISPECIES: hypothetical protein [unclassified Bradyrhizobium]|uniref:hypothetical protein n=1 Tax=unclassified Bradyrhizobium TaxID=2631580 RepID=UPI001CD3B0FC|nr:MULTISPECIES: hypothetical protein [unclassified Bradyrhizobium]
MVKSKWRALFKRLAVLWQEQQRNDTPEFFNWHALQHFAISCWIDAGFPPKTVQTFCRTFQLAGDDGPLRPPLPL